MNQEKTIRIETDTLERVAQEAQNHIHFRNKRNTWNVGSHQIDGEHWTITNEDEILEDFGY